MWCLDKRNQIHPDKRRGVVAALVLITIPVLIAVAALTIDIGAMYNTRADLQRAADSAALAGVAAFTSDTMMQFRQSAGNDSLLYEVTSAASGEVSTFSAMNLSFGATTMYIESGDIATGWLDVTSSTTPIQGSAPPTEFFNAVQVVARRSAGGQNGPLNFFFSSIFGQSTTDVSATAVAVFDDHVSGFNPESGTGYLIPFSIDRATFQAQFDAGSDGFEFDPDTGNVSPGSDGIGEVDIYPNNFGPGNFGLLNIGSPNQGNPALAEQIENGVTGDDMEAEIGTSAVTFFDSSGNPVTYDMTGGTGIKTALNTSVEARLGDVVAFLLHDHFVGDGQNGVYTITGIRFGRVMGVTLTGNPDDRGIWIQPTTYAGSGVMISASAPSSLGKAGRLVLAR